MKKSYRQFFLFGVIGIIGTTGHYAVLIGMVEYLGSQPVFATTIGFVVGALINYILNYHITFRSNKSHSEALLKFLIVAAFGAVFNSLIMYLGTEVITFHYIVAQVMATVIVLLWNFSANKYWTFSRKGMSA